MQRVHESTYSNSDKDSPPSQKDTLQLSWLNSSLVGWVKVMKNKGKKVLFGDPTSGDPTLPHIG
jgi:hypothetical protein